MAIHPVPHNLSRVSRSKMKDVGAHPIYSIPVKSTLLVLLTKCFQESRSFFRTGHDRPRVLAILAPGSLPIDTRFIARKERSDMSESQAYALPVHELLFGGLQLYWSLVVIDCVQPLGVCLQSQHEHRVMREWDFLRRPRGTPLPCILHAVSLQAQGHDALCTKADIDNLGPTDNVYGLIRMF